MSFHFFVKSNISFGAGAAAVLPELLAKHGLKKVMVIYDGGVKAAGISSKVLAEIEKAKVEAVVFDSVIPNPTNELVETAAAIARKRNRSAVLWRSEAEAALIPPRRLTS